MKKITVIILFTTLFLVIFQENHTTGIVNRAYGALTYDVLNEYEVRIENNASKVVTSMTVKAGSEQEAKDNVALNGWTVIGVSLISKGKDNDSFDLSTDSVNTEIPKNIELDNGLLSNDNNSRRDNGRNSLKAGINGGSFMPDNISGNINDNLSGSLQDNFSYAGNGNGGFKPDNRSSIPGNLDNGSRDNAGNNINTNNNGNNDNGSKGMLVSNDAGNMNVADNLDLLPDSPELELIMTIHFELGNVTPLFDDNLTRMVESLPKGKRYILFGNADEVSVGSNAPYSSNYELSYLRAEQIKKQLIEKGFQADKIRTVGLGTKYPIDKEKSESIKNRRVEIYGFRTQN